MPFTRSQKSQMGPSSSNTDSRTSSDTTSVTSSVTSSLEPETKDLFHVDQWEFEGIAYLLDGDSFVYDIFTRENIGYFDGVKILSVEEDGVWVEDKTKCITIKEERVTEYSETELLKIRIKQLETNLNNQKTQEVINTKVLEKTIEHQKNIAQNLTDKYDKAYTILLDKFYMLQVEYKSLKDLMEHSHKTTATVLENSGAFGPDTSAEDDTAWEEEVTPWEVEVKRKENVIRRKDAKATRLITIIREKNLELTNLQNSITQSTLYSQMLSSNMKIVSDENMGWRNYYANSYYTTQNTQGVAPNTQGVAPNTQGVAPNTTRPMMNDYTFP